MKEILLNEKCQIGIGVCLKRLWHELYGLYD